MTKNKDIGRTAQFVHDFYFEQYHSLQDLSVSIKINPDEEIIHEYRLCIKRIRLVSSYLTRALELPDTVFKEPLKRTDSTYASMGNLRNIQVQLMLLNELEDVPGSHYADFSNYFEKKALKQVIKIKNIKTPVEIPGILPAPAEFNKLLLENYKLLNTKSIRLFLVNKTKFINSLYSDWLQDEKEKTLHLMRRELKEMYFLMLISGYQTLSSEGYKFSISTSRKWEQLLGRWHDLSMILNSLEKFSGKHEGGKFNEDYSILKGKIEERIEQSLDIVRNKFTLLIQNAE